jgi:hypothetical protein
VFTENGDIPIRTKSVKIKSFHPDRRNPDEKQIQKSAVNTDDFVKALSEKLSTVLEESKANDPAELKREVAKLKRDLAAKPVETKEVSILTDEDRRLLNRVLEGGCDKVIESFEKLQAKQVECVADLKRFFEPIKLKLSAQSQRTPPVLSNSSGIGRCERSILTALAQYPKGRSANQVAILAGYSSGSGGFNNSLSKLRSSDCITRGNPIQITDSGLSALGDYQPLPTGPDLIAYWCGKLSKCEREILTYLTGIYPNYALSSEAAEATGYAPSSGGFNNSLSKLRTLELITRGQPMQASKELFE